MVIRLTEMVTGLHGRSIITEKQVPWKLGDSEDQANEDSKCGQLIGRWWLQELEMKSCQLQGNRGSQEFFFKWKRTGSI